VRLESRADLEEKSCAALASLYRSGQMRAMRDAAEAREPARLLFLLGTALAAAGVLPWIPFALGMRSLYEPLFASIGWRSTFHPLVEVQGFLSCFAVGFLYTQVPRRTGARPPSRAQLAVALGAPILLVVFAFRGQWLIAQLLWLSLLLGALAFALRRLGPRGGPATPWIAAGLLMGAAGGVLAWLGAGNDLTWSWLHDVGRGLLLQGLFTGLSLGMAEVVLDVHATPSESRPLALALHAAGAALLCFSFYLEARTSARVGFALRAALTLVAVAMPLRRALQRAEASPRRRLASLALWMLPLGYAWVAIEPRARRAGLHVVYLGCFSALALLFAVPPPEGTRLQRLRDDRLAQAVALLWLSMGARVMLELDPANFHIWLGVAAALFVLVAFSWLPLLRAQ
jgi:uncharacterized protein involved in response to NO